MVTSFVFVSFKNQEEEGLWWVEDSLSSDMEDSFSGSEMMEDLISSADEDDLLSFESSEEEHDDTDAVIAGNGFIIAVNSAVTCDEGDDLGELWATDESMSEPSFEDTNDEAWGVDTASIGSLLDICQSEADETLDDVIQFAEDSDEDSN